MRIIERYRNLRIMNPVKKQRNLNDIVRKVKRAKKANSKEGTQQ